MAWLYVTEYSDIIETIRGATPVPKEPPVVPEYKIAITSTASAPVAFNAATRFVALHTDVSCSILIGQNPVPTSTNRRMPADDTQYRGVNINSGLSVAVIQNP